MWWSIDYSNGSGKCYLKKKSEQFSQFGSQHWDICVPCPSPPTQMTSVSLRYVSLMSLNIMVLRAGGFLEGAGYIGVPLSNSGNSQCNVHAPAHHSHSHFHECGARQWKWRSWHAGLFTYRADISCLFQVLWMCSILVNENAFFFFSGQKTHMLPIVT